MGKEIKGIHYFNGLFMKAEEFELEQNYHKRMRRLHNRYLHTWGIVWGLDINKSTKAGALPSDVTVTEGMALNKVAEGGEELSKEIILTEDRDVSLAAYGAGKGIYIYISYEEKPVKKDEKDIEETYRVEEARLGSETDRSKIIESESIILGKVTLVDKNGTLTVDKIEFEEGGKSLRRYAGPSGKSLETDRITLAIAGVASGFPTIEGKTIGSDNGISIDSPRTIFSGALSVKGMLDAGGNISLPDNAGLVLGTTNAVNLHGNKDIPEVWLEATNQASAALVIGTAFDYDRQVRIKYTPGAEGAASGELLIGQDAKSVGTFTHGITSLLTNGAKRLTIDAAGNVTVLTGSLRIPTNDTSLDFGSDTRQMINLYGNGPNAAYGIGIQGWTMYSRSAGNFAWYIGGAHSDTEMDPGGGTPALVIKRGTGNVGIGTPNPSGKLQIYDGKYGSLGFGGNTEDLWFDGGADSIFWFKNIGGPTGRTSFVTGTTELMTVLNKGNVGIGTAGPSAKLEVNLINSSGWGGNLKGFRLLSPDNNYYLDINTYIVASGNVGYHFSPNGNAGLCISTPGLVGIGTAGPADKLDVAGNLRILTGSNPIRFTGGWTSFPDAVTNQAEISNDTGTYKTLMIVGNKSGGFGRRVSVWDRLEVNGVVGIGTASIDSQLEVAGNIHIGAGSIFYSHGRMHIHGEELLYLLNKSGVIIGKEWGGNGNLVVEGQKNFRIDHPLDAEHKYLTHSTLEGPEVGVYYRGEAQLNNGQAIIQLPDYFEALTRKENRTVLLTPKFENDSQVSMLAASEVEYGKFTVKMMDRKNPSQKFYWEVKAVRADVDVLEVETLKPS